MNKYSDMRASPASLAEWNHTIPLYHAFIHLIIYSWGHAAARVGHFIDDPSAFSELPIVNMWAVPISLLLQIGVPCVALDTHPLFILLPAYFFAIEIEKQNCWVRVQMRVNVAGHYQIFLHRGSVIFAFLPARR